MRWVALILVLLAAPLAAMSPASPQSFVRPVGDRHQWLLVYKHDRNGEAKSGRDALPDRPETREFACSGLYANDGSRKLIWQDHEGWIDPYFNGLIFLSRDGGRAHLAYESDQGAALAMLHLGRTVHTTYLGGPLYSPRERMTHPGWPRLAWTFQQAGGQLFVRRARDGDGWCFSLENGDLARIRTPATGQPTTDDLKAFEVALAQADAPADIPAGATLHVSYLDSVRILRVPAISRQAERTLATDADGKELWQVEEYLPVPWFLGSQLNAGTMSHWHSPWSTAEPRHSPLIVARGGSSWAIVTVTESDATAKVRHFREGQETVTEVKGTHEGPLKFSGTRVFEVSDHEMAVEFRYGVEWAEQHVFNLRTGEQKHQRPPDPVQPQESQPSRVTCGAAPIVALGFAAACVLLLVGFLVGRRFASK